LLDHEQNALAQIQDWSDVPRHQPLFETLLVFENFAGNGSSFDLNGRIELIRSHLSRTNYPLTIVVDPGEHPGRIGNKSIESDADTVGRRPLDEK